MKTLSKIALAVFALLATVVAEARPGWMCYRATENLNAAQARFNHAQMLVLNNPVYCPGGWERNAACMMTIANNYNQAQVELQRAQEFYNRACYRF